MTVSFWQADGTQPVREVDFLIVGAGIVGCAAAYFAAQAGREVVITEMRDVALGASSRNAGFMITGLDTYYHTAVEIYGRDQNPRIVGALRKDARLLARLRRARQRAAGSLRLAAAGGKPRRSERINRSRPPARRRRASRRLSTTTTRWIAATTPPSSSRSTAACSPTNWHGRPSRQRRGTRQQQRGLRHRADAPRRGDGLHAPVRLSRRNTSCSAPTPIRRACIPISSAKSSRRAGRCS